MASNNRNYAAMVKRNLKQNDTNKNKSTESCAIELELGSQRNVTSTSGQNSLDPRLSQLNKLKNDLDNANECIQSNVTHIKRSKKLYLRCLLEKYRFKMFQKYTGQPRTTGTRSIIKGEHLKTLTNRGYEPNHVYAQHSETTNFMEDLLEILVTTDTVEDDRERKIIDFSRGWPIHQHLLKPYKCLSEEIHFANESNLKDVLNDYKYMELLDDHRNTYKNMFKEVFSSQP